MILVARQYTAPMKALTLLLTMLPAAFASVGGGGNLDALQVGTQLMVVTTSGWDAVAGRLQRYERAAPGVEWRPVGKPVAIVVGEHGTGWGIGVVATEGARAASDPLKREGDGKSPAGVFALGSAFGYAAQPLPGLKMRYRTLTPTVECVDDVRSAHYNRIVDRSVVAADWNSSEHMRDAGESYVWGMVVDHNNAVADRGDHAPLPGGGSCIFLHVWHSQRQGTAGCTAMAQNDLLALLGWLDPARKPLLVQMPQSVYQRVSEQWRLPRLVEALR